MKAQAAKAAASISGEITKIIFQSANYTIGELDHSTTVKGPVFLALHETVNLQGRWGSDRFGKHFYATQALRDKTFSMKGLESWLAINPAFKHIGPVRAKKLVQTFGRDFDRIIKEEPSRIAEYLRLPQEAVENIRFEWLRREATIAVETELAAFGLSAVKIKAVLDRLGDDAAVALRTKPQVLYEVFGFKTADKPFLNMGFSKTDTSRIRAGIFACLDEALDKGNCWIEEFDLIEQANKLLIMDTLNSRDIIEHELDALIKERKLACDSHDGRWLVARKDIHAMEREVEAVLRNGDRDHPLVMDLLGIWQKVRDGKLCPELNPKQREAVVVALTNQISTISGGGGSGKTFTIGKLTKLYEDLGFSVQLCALAGKAARRLEEVVGVRASTIHRLLGFNGHEWARGPDDPIDANIVIVDESSMVDIPLAWRLLRSIDHDKTAVVFVGDHNQLPPVGPGDLLRDMIHTGIVPGVVLTDIVRQAGELRKNSIDVLSGKVAKTSQSVLSTGRRPWYRIDNFSDAWDVRRLICDLYETVLADKLGYDLIDDVQLLTPKRKDPLGVEELNLELQRLIQKKLHGVDVPVLKPKQRPHFLLHDKVIQRRNNYDLGIMNGSIGRVTEVFSNGDLRVRFDNADVLLGRSDGDLNDLQLAYVLTIHQTQGSEFPCAIVVIHKSHSFMHSQNLFYTGVSRAQETTIIVGDRWGIRNCAQKQANDNRSTFLGLWRKDGQVTEHMEVIHG